MQKNIAVFKEIQYQYETLGERDLGDSYVQLTDFVVVDFPERPAEEIIEKQVAALEAAKEELRAKAQQKQDELDEKIQKLRAITHQPEPAVDDPTLSTEEVDSLEGEGDLSDHH